MLPWILMVIVAIPTSVLIVSYVKIIWSGE